MKTVLALCALLTLVCAVELRAQRVSFTLEIPSANVVLRPREKASIPHALINRLILRINKPPQVINYGDIVTRINGVSANIIMTARSDSQGIVCDFDLNLRPGFELQRGRNSFEAMATDFYGRTHYSSFLIEVEEGGKTGPVPGIRLVRVGEGGPTPELTLLEPTEGVAADVGTVTISGYVEYEDSDVSVLVFGRRAELAPTTPTPEGGQKRDLRVISERRRHFRSVVEVPDGLEEIVVEVRNEVGRGVDARIPLLAPTQSLGAVGERYAVVIGVSKYQAASEALPDLQYADDDARAIRDLLLSEVGGFRPGNVITLIDEDATSRNMRSALLTFLTRPKKEDLVLIYFAGHGAADPNNPIDHYFITHDSRPMNLGGTAFPMWHLRDVFARTIKAQRVVTFADACHSAGIGEAAVDGFNLVNQSFQRYASIEGRAVLTGSDLGESSFESARWGGGHGVFTHFLLQGASGPADRNGDRRVTVQELFDYIRSEVTQEMKGVQNPVAMPGRLSGQTLFHLGAS